MWDLNLYLEITKLLYIRLLLKNLFGREHAINYTEECDFDMITQYLQQILHLSCQILSLPSFKTPCPCSVLKLLQTQRGVFF